MRLGNDDVQARSGPQYGSDLLVDTIKKFGIEYISYNPGASWRGIHDSLMNYDQGDLHLVPCPHEKVAVTLAHGYTKVTGKPMAVILHDVVGLLHGTMGIFYAYLDQAPVLVLGGTGPLDADKRRPHIDWIHTAVVQGNAVRDYVKWDDQPHSIEAIPDSFARAYRIAMTEPRGPVYLCYDVEVQEGKLTSEVPIPDPVKAQPPKARVPSPDQLAEAAEMLAKARHPVIVAEYAGRDPQAVSGLERIAQRLGAPVMDLGQRFNFPNTNPLYAYPEETQLLKEADAVLAVDVINFYGVLRERDTTSGRYVKHVSESCRLIHLGYIDQGLRGWVQNQQALQPVDLVLEADPAPTLDLLEKAISERADAGFSERVRVRTDESRKRHQNIRKAWREKAREGWDTKPMTTARLASELGEVLEGEDWVLTANTLREWTKRLWDFDAHGRHPGGSLGTATQISMSLGVALAYKNDPKKIIVDIQPDGDLMFDAGALWVASNQRLPMLIVMYNNRAYYNDWEHQWKVATFRDRDLERGASGLAVEDPYPDFPALARSMGVEAIGTFEDPSGVKDALKKGLEYVKRERKPFLVDIITQLK